MLKMLLIIALLVAVAVFPEDNPDCATPWSLLFHFENSIHCGGGEYFLFVCQPPLGNGGSIFQAFCLSSITNNLERNFIYLPIVQKGW